MVNCILVSEAVQRPVLLPQLLIHTGVSTGERSDRSRRVSSLPALGQQQRRGTEVEAIEAGQGVSAGNPLVEAAGPVLGQGEVGGWARGRVVRGVGGPEVSQGEELEREEEGQ